MTELEYYKKLADWLGKTGKLTPRDIMAFAEHLDDERRLREAKDFVDENFKGMF